jgi:hypothetical protein
MSATLVVSPNNAMSYSAFGDGDQDIDARSLLQGDRFVEIERRSSYYECTQHDRKFWDFDGRPINPRTMQPLLGAEKSWWVPLKMRRPHTPVRLGKVIVDSFTNLLFGENRFPDVGVEGDELTEDWLQTAIRVGKLPQKMIQARAYGGAAGTVGVSWCFRDGKPRFEVHNAKNLFVHKWADRLELIPESVSEVYLFSKVKWDGKGFNKVWYWFRRMWTPEADYVFKDVVFTQGEEPVWEVDDEKSTFHQDGVCHLEWIQNLPTDEQDGLPDYDGLYENFDHVDLIMSVITRGAILNLDPTVKLKMDRDEVSRLGIKKGSDNALIVGKDGDADYLELGGQSITSGLELVKELRRYILETAQCIVPDPHEVAAQGVSSVAIKAMFAPMLAKADIIREQYGSAIERILTKMEKVAREKTSSTMMMTELVTQMVPQHVMDEVTGEMREEMVEETVEQESPVQFVIELPPKVTEIPLIDPLTGGPMATGEMQIVSTPRVLGPGGGEIMLTWPPYFPPTPADQNQIVTALQLATGGKPVLSQETAVEAAARAFNVDPSEEWQRVQTQGHQDQAAQAAMMDTGAAGGQVDDPNQLPVGAEPKPGEGEGPPPAPVDPDEDVQHDVDRTGG